MSRESRDGRRPHESDDDARSNHVGGPERSRAKSSRKTSPKTRGGCIGMIASITATTIATPMSSLAGSTSTTRHRESSDDDERSSSDDADAETPHRHASDRPAAGPPHSHHAHDRPHDHTRDRSDEQVTTAPRTSQIRIL